MSGTTISPSFSHKLRRARELKDIIDHRKKRDKVWEQALNEYVDLILELSRRIGETKGN